MKIDPYKHKERWENWKDKTNSIPEISEFNSQLLLKYLDDMEKGINVASTTKKGARSPTRLNTLRTKLIFMIKELEQRFNLNKITSLKEEQLLSFFANLRSGEIKNKFNKPYKSVRDFVKIFKAFWHWYQKTSKKKDIEIQDITMDLDTSGDKPEWVYLTEEQTKILCDKAKYEYKVLIMFLFDTGIRAPTELINVKVSDLYNNCKELHIREEISKTFGRKIKLMICSDLLKTYIQAKSLSQEDYLFPIKPNAVNKYLKRLAKNIFGDKKSPAGQKYSDLTMYDFRHISCCYWLPRYKSESALKYRFGWKKSDKIHYYSELLGMKDTISEEDLLIDVTKTEIEKRLIKAENDKEIMQERVDALESHVQKILERISGMCIKVEV